MEAIPKKSLREAYKDALLSLGESHPDLVVLDADVGSSTRGAHFGKRYPERYLNVGAALIATCVAPTRPLAVPGRPVGAAQAAILVNPRLSPA